MRLTGPYQHCDKCGCPKPHFWVEEYLLECGGCKKQTKIAKTALKRQAVIDARKTKEGIATLNASRPPVVVVERSKTGKPLVSARAQIIDFAQDYEEKVSEKDSIQFRKDYLQEPVPEIDQPKPVVKKGWADGL